MPLDLNTHWPQFLVNASLIQEWVGFENVLGVYWTLEVELLFYLLCGTLFFMGLMDRPVWRLVVSMGFLGLSIVLAALAWSQQRHLPLAPTLSLSIMFWATLWQGWIISSDPFCRRLARIGLVALVVAMPVVTLVGYNATVQSVQGGEGWNRLGTYWAAIGLFVLLTLAFRGRSWGPRPLVWLGTISYSVYLLHTLVMYAGEATGVMAWMKQFPPTCYFILVIVVSIGLGSLSWYLVERSCTLLGRRWTPWEKRRATGAESPS